MNHIRCPWCCRSVAAWKRDGYFWPVSHQAEDGMCEAEGRGVIERIAEQTGHSEPLRNHRGEVVNYCCEQRMARAALGAVS